MAERRRRGRKSKRAVGAETADLRHVSDRRRNNPSSEDAPTMTDAEREPSRYYADRDPDLDPQLVWRGKSTDELEVVAPPIYIQERIRPKALIEDLRRYSRAHPVGGGESGDGTGDGESQAELFADFNGLPSAEARTEFYQHDANWTNRLILGDSLQVMASLAEKEGLKGQVQCVYLDPPYGINFRSNWQWSTKTRIVAEGRQHITREPEPLKAYRDSWSGGIHSYLGYLRDRLELARQLLAPSGSIFVQIGDEHVHRVRSLLDEVFGDGNYVTQISYRVTTGTSRSLGPLRIQNYILWYAKERAECKYRPLLMERSSSLASSEGEDSVGGRAESESGVDGSTDVGFSTAPLHSSGSKDREPREFEGRQYVPPANAQWRHSRSAFDTLVRADRVVRSGSRIRSKQYHSDTPVMESNNFWTDTAPEQHKGYVVQTSTLPVQRCILMTTDPGDLVLDPTCGGGTTAYVAEQWGRRWITVDTSRVALAITRARIMGARYPYYVLSDSAEGVAEEARLSGSAPKMRGGVQRFGGRIRGCGGGGVGLSARRSAGVRLRTGAAYHAGGDCEQRRDRRYLAALPR